jgi:uncharacterized membrane protein YqhA
MKNILSSSRYLVLLAVLAAFAAAVSLLVFGAYETALEIGKILQGEIPSSVATAFIEIADLFLLGVVMYIIALGLYELFIDDNLVLPHWLEIHTLDDLKAKLISVIIVVMGVLFLEQVVSWDGERNLLTFGGGVALVIAALTYFLASKEGKEKSESMEK